MEAVAPMLRSILPAQPGRWLLTRAIFYMLVGLIAVAGFFIFAPSFGVTTEGSLSQATVPFHWIMDFVGVVFAAMAAWTALSHRARRLPGFVGGGWSTADPTVIRGDLKEASPGHFLPPIEVERDVLQKQLESTQVRVQQLEAERDLLQEQRDLGRRSLDAVSDRMQKQLDGTEARVRELEAERDLLQKQKEWQRQDQGLVVRLLELVTSKAAMTQIIGEALRGAGWTLDEQELANIVSKAMDEMNKIADQRPQQAVDHSSPVNPGLP